MMAPAQGLVQTEAEENGLAPSVQTSNVEVAEPPNPIVASGAYSEAPPKRALKPGDEGCPSRHGAGLINSELYYGASL